jgi:hypothetical protein
VTCWYNSDIKGEGITSLDIMWQVSICLWTGVAAPAMSLQHMFCVVYLLV